MHHGLFEMNRSGTSNDFGPVGRSIRASCSQPELIAVRALDSMSDGVGKITRQETTDFKEGTASLDLAIVEGESKSSQKNRRTPSLLPTSSFFGSNLTPRINLRRRRRTASEHGTQHVEQPEQKPEQRKRHSNQDNPIFYKTSTAVVDFGENVTDSCGSVQEGTAMNDDAECYDGNDVGGGGPHSDQRDVGTEISSKWAFSASKTRVHDLQSPGHRDRRIPLFSIVKSMAKSLVPTSSTSKNRPDMELVDAVGGADKSSPVVDDDHERKSLRNLSFDRVLRSRFRKSERNRSETQNRSSKDTGKDDFSSTIEAKENEAVIICDTGGDKVEYICNTDGDYVERQDSILSNELSICQPSAFPLRKFPCNGGDTVTSSIYEHTVASVDSAYCSFTVGRASEVAVSNEPAAEASKRERRLGVSGITGTDDIEPLDGYGLKRGFFDGFQKGRMDDADSRSGFPTPVSFKAQAWTNEESALELSNDEKLVPFVAIDIEDELSGSVQSPATRKKSDVILPLSLDGGPKMRARSLSQTPLVKDRFSVNRVLETTHTDRASPPPQNALASPNDLDALNSKFLPDSKDSYSTICNPFEESGTLSHRSFAEASRWKKKHPSPEVFLVDETSRVNPSVKNPKNGVEGALTPPLRIDSISSELARPFLSSLNVPRRREGLKCSEQQLINGSPYHDECFFFRGDVPLPSVPGVGTTPEGASERKLNGTDESGLQQSELTVKAKSQDDYGNSISGPRNEDLRETSLAHLSEKRLHRALSRESKSYLIEPSLAADPNIALDNCAYHATVTVGKRGPICQNLFPANELSNESVPPVFVGTPRPGKRVCLVEKHGTTNITHSNIPGRWLRYWSDIFTTMLGMKWRYVFVIFASQFFLSWLFFAAIWYLICWAHGDFEETNKVKEPRPCVTGMKDFTSAILFSIETQHTIGYGTRSATEECAVAVFVVMIQSIIGIFGQACIVGLVFSKLARPKKRAQTLLLSKRAVVCLRDKKYRLLFRVGDVRPGVMTDCKVQAILIQRKTTKEGESIPLHQTSIGLETSDLFLTWPIVIGHEIDSDSPFYCMDENNMNNLDFELVIVVEGNVEATAMRTQIRTSFLPDEIFWGYHFEPCVRFSEGRYIVDYSKFHEIVQCHMPKVSAKKWEELEETYLTGRQQRESSGEADPPILTRERVNNDVKESGEAESTDSASSEPSLASTNAPREPAAQLLITRNASTDCRKNAIDRTSPLPNRASPASSSNGVHMNVKTLARGSPNESHS